MKMSWRGIDISAILLLTFILILGSSSSVVRALPILHSVTVSESGDHTILTMEINQTVWEGCQECGDYMLVNYVVTAVAVKLDGEEPIIQNITASENAVITVIFDLGVLESRPQAEIGICAESGGWTPWFEPFEVPEFTLVLVVLLFVALTSSLVLLKFRRNRIIPCNRKNG
jgi:hypothetical protein